MDIRNIHRNHITADQTGTEAFAQLEDIVPSRWDTRKIVKIVILSALALLIVGCMAANSPKNATCTDGGKKVSGIVAYEKNGIYGINNNGTVIEFAKDRCTIR